jgi:organic hydroperoxide reductase OsmC/OhrA
MVRQSGRRQRAAWLHVGSGAFDGPYAFTSRSEEGQSATNPEEPIGAAHAGGLRAHARIALGAAAFVALGALLPGSHDCDADRGPSRVEDGVLGAEVILREGLHGRGLNTDLQEGVCDERH